MTNCKHCLIQAQQNAISTLVRVAPSVVLPPLVDYVCKSLSDPALKNVTREEYAIMNWPEGDLYDKSVIQRWAKTVWKGQGFGQKKACFRLFSCGLDPKHFFTTYAWVVLMIFGTGKWDLVLLSTSWHDFWVCRSCHRGELLYTPVGLFTSSLRPLCIGSGTQNEEKVANVKRENKLYSYEEQMADLELKKVWVWVGYKMKQNNQIVLLWAVLTLNILCS